jgi:hypothetical protein
VVEHLDDTGVDEDTGRDAVEDADGEEGGAGVGVVGGVYSHTDRDTDGGDELCPEDDQ